MAINPSRQQQRLKATEAKIEKVKNDLKHQRTLKTQTENAKAEAESLRLKIPVLKQMRDDRVNVLATYLGEQSCLPPDKIDEKALEKTKTELAQIRDNPLPEEDTLAAMDAKGYDTTIIDLNISDLELALEELLRTESDQSAALSRKERAYPWLLSAHLRRCANSGHLKDKLGRTKNKAKEMKEAVLKAEADRAKAEQDRIEALAKAEQDRIAALAEAELREAVEHQTVSDADAAEVLSMIAPEPEQNDSAPADPPTEAATAGLGDQP
jgi:hypothetical protein